MSSSFLRAFILLGLPIVLGLTYKDWALWKTSELPVLGTLPVFELSDISSRTISTETYKDKILVVNFFFTSCPKICPAITGKIRSLNKTFADEARLKFLSVSVDPERDTLEKLKNYAQKFSADGESWNFARGDIEQIRSMANGFKLDAGDVPDLHTTRLAVVDSKGRIRALTNALDPETESVVEEAISSLLRDPL